MVTVTFQKGLILSLALLIIILNLISFYLIAKCRKLAFQARILSLSLACTDIGIGLVMFLRIFEVDYSSNVVCQIIFHSKTVFNLVTCFIITALAGDRFFAICFPLCYQTWMTENKIRYFSVALWVLGLILSLILMVQPRPFGRTGTCDYAMMTHGGFAFPLLAGTYGVIMILNIVFYLGIFLTLSPWKRQVLPMGSEQAEEQKKMQKLILLKILGITALFVVCYYPYMIVFLLAAVWDHERFDDGIIFIRLTTLMLMNSVFSPFVYVWRYRECRYHLLLLVCWWNRRKQKEIEEGYRSKLASNDL